MPRAVRIILLSLLALAISAQGVAARTKVHCAAKQVRVGGAVATHARAAVELEQGRVEARPDSTRLAAASPRADVDPDRPSDRKGGLKHCKSCSACAACCSAAAPPLVLAEWQSSLPAAKPYDLTAPALVRHAVEGPDRPPKLATRG